ncbi:MAG TPA: hypothetical protein VF789_26765 [Thermoanaerobaculia bacterium]
MPELIPESTSPPAAIPPIVDPSDFEDHPAFRETFLLYFSDPEANAAFRAVGDLLYDFVLEYWQNWPEHPEGLLRASLRAAVADMRHVQGFLAEWASPDTAHGSPHEEHLAAFGGGIAHDLGVLADRLETELGPWRGEVG